MTALLLVLLIAGRAPLACPEGTEHRGVGPADGGAEEWCVSRQPDGSDRREGPTVTYYDDGGTWVESRYHEGLLDGGFVERYRGGRITREGAYEAGYKTGRWRSYREDGALEEESSWRHGALHGPFTSYWPNGKPRTTGRHCHGVQCGLWRSFDEAGGVQGSAEFLEIRDEP